jgi:hypothetical protein
MKKVKEKVPGCFRQLHSVNEFVLISSYLMVAKKQLTCQQSHVDPFYGGLISFISQEGRPVPGAMGESGRSLPPAKLHRVIVHRFLPVKPSARSRPSFHRHRHGDG